MAAPKTYLNLIDAEWVPSRSGQTFENLNPADTRDVVGVFQRSNKVAMPIRPPVGVCGMIPPWNFPMAIPSWKLFPALVCGNTCVIKPAEDTPLSTINIVQALVDAGLPKGVVNIVTGFGPEAGAPLVNHPDVRAISFTGSS